MSGYGDVAVEAVLHCHKWSADPVVAWEIAAKTRFPRSKSSQTKSCPRGAFLGLCSAGLICGVPVKEVDYRPGRNAGYAVLAFEILRQKRTPAPDAKALWRKVIGGETKAPNGQMAVVLALWNRKLLHGS